jgi:beta-lactamase superfamily II metal-dependent hydrolase
MAEKQTIKLYVLNVGEGSANVIHFPYDNSAILIDACNAEVIKNLLINVLQIKHLPLIIITHTHFDHINGLIKVIEACHEKGIKTGLVLW